MKSAASKLDIPERSIYAEAELDHRLQEAMSDLICDLFDGFAAPHRRSVLVAACDPHSGVSFFCSSLAMVLSQLQGDVLLADAERVRASFEGKRRIEECEIVRASVPSLWTLAQPAITRATPAAFDSDCSWGELRKRFRYSIIDAPALAVSDTALKISGRVEGVILLAVEGQTEMRDLRNAQKNIARWGGKILGAVLNRFSPPDPYEGVL